MTLLWLSMMTFYGRGAWERFGAGEDGTAVLAAGVADGLDRAWETCLELFETTVMLYRLQTEFGDVEMHITDPTSPAHVPPGEPSKEGGADAPKREAP